MQSLDMANHRESLFFFERQLVDSNALLPSVKEWQSSHSGILRQGYKTEEIAHKEAIED